MDSEIIKLNQENLRYSSLIGIFSSVTYCFVCSLLKPTVRLEFLAFTNSIEIEYRRNSGSYNIKRKSLPQKISCLESLDFVSSKDRAQMAGGETGIPEANQSQTHTSKDPHGQSPYLRTKPALTSYMKEFFGSTPQASA
jgi:hypothetical protein